MEALLEKKLDFRLPDEQNKLEQIFHLENRVIELNQGLRYAGRLQQAILPNESIFRRLFNDAFVCYFPKDLVSGDFYWIYEHNNAVYVAVGDCTGHGVPGALITIAGNTMLRQIIKNENITNPSKILKKLDYEITSLFNDNLTTGTTQDGMDIAFCKFNLDTLQAQFCGAGRPLIMVRKGELIEFKKGKAAIGHEISERKKYFETIPIKLEKGDMLYLFSDGYTDQFGGENVKKFNRQRFRKLLLSIADMNLKKQKEELICAFRNWKGDQEQIDDVTLMGLKI